MSRTHRSHVIRSPDWTALGAVLCAIAALRGMAFSQLPVRYAANDASSGDHFGSSVDVDTARVLIGAPGADLAPHLDAGSAYVFDTAVPPTQLAKLVALDPQNGAAFGSIVALHGTRAVVTAPNDDPLQQRPDAGSIYVFSNVGSTWIQQQKVMAGDPQSKANFGASISQSDEIIVVGAPRANGAKGAVYVFTKTVGPWAQTQKLTALDGVARDEFGSSVAISGDTLVVGAALDNGSRGSIYVFRYSSGAWVQSDKIASSEHRWFGRASSLLGQELLAGRAGEAALFRLQAGGHDELQSMRAIGLDQLRIENVELSRCLLVAGSPNDGAGRISIFERSSGGMWRESLIFKNEIDPGNARFGISVGIDGRSVVVGAPWNDLPGRPDSGAAYLYQVPICDQASWSQVHPGGATAPSPREQFGLASDTHRNRIVLFGGSAFSSSYNDTWEWDGTQWLPITPLHSPPKRWGCAMVYDRARERTILFGGQDFGGVVLNDLWEWNGSDWAELPATTPSPSPTCAAVMAYDVKREVTVLYSSCGSGSVDTWEWKGSGPQANSWVQLGATTVGSPGHLYYHAMVYDEAREVTVLYGGRDTGGVPQRHTWTWDGQLWQLLSSNGPGNEVGIYHSMGYDASSGHVVMNGPGQPFTWLWDGSSWTSVQSDNGPRQRSGMAWDDAQERLLMFGGIDENVGGVWLDDTWAWCGCGDS